MDLGEEGAVVRLVGGRGFITKLDAMRIRIGTKLRKLGGEPFGGPIIVEVEGINKEQIAIGHGMADRIIVEVK